WRAQAPARAPPPPWRSRSRSPGSTCKKKAPEHLTAPGALLYSLLLVEAAGIEPASESLLPFDPTCVVRALLRPESSHGRDHPSQSWKDLPSPSPRTLGGQTAL